MSAEHRTSLALVFGGRSVEHEVSVVSARSIAGALRRDRYDLTLMAIDRRGRWADPETARRVLETSGDRTDQVIDFEGSDRLDRRLLDGSVDVAFPVLHGPYGEDGTIQGLFEMLDIPYVGCDHAASAVCMDKSISKRLFVQAGLPTAPWHAVIRQDWTSAAGEARSRCLALGLPLFVKPARLGSSVGVSKVTDAEGLGPGTRGGLRPRRAGDRGARARCPRDRGRSARQRRPARLGAGRGRAGPRVLRLRRQVPRRRLPAAGAGAARLRHDRSRCSSWRWPPSGHSGVRGWRGSTSSWSAPTARCGSTRSTPSRASPRSRCTRACWGLSGLPYPDLLDDARAPGAQERHRHEEGGLGLATRRLAPASASREPPRPVGRPSLRLEFRIATGRDLISGRADVDLAPRAGGYVPWSWAIRLRGPPDTTSRSHHEHKEGHARGGARVPHREAARQDCGGRHQALPDAARPLAGLHARRRRAVPRDRARPGAGLRVHQQGQPGRGDLERHRRARPRRHRRPRRQAGDGGQGRPLQALRRHRRVRHRGRHARPRGGHPLLPAARADLRRHQPRGHQGARVLLHRGDAQEDDEDPGLPRRPARHRDHLRRGAAQRARARRQEDRRGQGGVLRRRRRRHRLRQVLPARSASSPRTSSWSTPRA